MTENELNKLVGNILNFPKGRKIILTTNNGIQKATFADEPLPTEYIVDYRGGKKMLDDGEYSSDIFELTPPIKADIADSNGTVPTRISKKYIQLIENIEYD